MWNIFKNKKNKNLNQKIETLKIDLAIEKLYIESLIKEYVETKIEYKDRISNRESNETYLIEISRINKLCGILHELEELDAHSNSYINSVLTSYYIYNDYLYKYTINGLIIPVNNEVKNFVELKIEKGIKILD